ncbi:uncharacterized protein [Phaseolus vulgaris]|uniref:uncharacterized protein n=1 Tax=Phaseolus vulgaris TaxID=3885 RepID=UPI0035CC41BD
MDVFLYFFEAKNPGKKLWMSFNGVAGRVLLTLFQQSYKSFKGKFFKICCSKFDPALLDGFPFYWVEKPGLKKPRCLEDLASQDREGAVLEWFVSLPDRHITNFDQFATLFREQYLVNKALTRLAYEVFDVKQYQGESMKDYLNRFGVQVVRLKLTDEAMIVHAFVKGMLPGPFCESLLRFYPKTFTKIRRRALAHIAADDRVTQKQGLVGPARPRATTRPPQMRVHEATTEKKGAGKPYEWTPIRARKDPPPKHNIRVELKELIAIPNIVAKLKVPTKTDMKMGPNKNAWCEFHQANDHYIRNCLALAHQLDELVKNGFLKDYL